MGRDCKSTEGGADVFDVAQSSSRHGAAPPVSGDRPGQEIQVEPWASACVLDTHYLIPRGCLRRCTPSKPSGPGDLGLPFCPVVHTRLRTLDLAFPETSMEYTPTQARTTSIYWRQRKDAAFLPPNLRWEEIALANAMPAGRALRDRLLAKK